MSRNVRLGLAVLAFPAAFACSDSTGPEAAAELRIKVEPSMIAPGDTFVLAVAVINPTPRPMRLLSGCGGILYWLNVSDGHTYLDGANHPCLTVAHAVELPPGGVVHQYRVRLARFDDEEIEPGVYRIEAEAMASQVDASGARAELRVKED
ncbi:MAG: hypothetical protein FWJ74_11835 [Gemmatimonadota bacterium]|jgi:hypothetical protein